jgi:hypothetical protein
MLVLLLAAEDHYKHMLSTINNLLDKCGKLQHSD